MKVTIFLKKSWIVILIILVSLIGLVIFWRRNQGAHEKTVAPLSENTRGFQIEADQISGLNIKVPGGENNSYWVLNFAKFTDLGADGGLDTISGEYYRNSKLLYRLTAISGTIHWQSQKLKFNSPVVDSVDNSRRLSASEMLWEPKTKKVSANRQVVVRVNDFTIRTEELVSDFELERMFLKGLTTAGPK